MQGDSAGGSSLIRYVAEMYTLKRVSGDSQKKHKQSEGTSTAKIHTESWVYDLLCRNSNIRMKHDGEDRKMLFRATIGTFAIVFLVLDATPMLPQTAQAEHVGAGLNSGAPDPLVGRRLANYILGPGDEISIMSIYAPEIAKGPIRITTSGDINLAMVGRFHAAGLTVERLEEDVRERLKAYVKDPDIVVNLTQLKSQPVSVIGAVGSPGVVQLEGVKTLVEVLSMVGGVRPDAGARIKITRRLEWGTIPLPPQRSMESTAPRKSTFDPLRTPLALRKISEFSLTM